jgi:hypothetical protein
MAATGYALAASSDSDDSDDEAARQAQADAFAEELEATRAAAQRALVRESLTALLLAVTDGYGCAWRTCHDVDCD